MYPVAGGPLIIDMSCLYVQLSSYSDVGKLLMIRVLMHDKYNIPYC